MYLDFQPRIFQKQSTVSGPLMNRLKHLYILFFFREDIQLQSSKFACWWTSSFLTLGSHFKIFKIHSAMGYVNTPKYFFPDCSFTVNERPPKFTVDVWIQWIVIVMSLSRHTVKVTKK